MIWTWFILTRQGFTNFTMLGSKMKPFSTDSWFELFTSTLRGKTLPQMSWLLLLINNLFLNLVLIPCFTWFPSFYRCPYAYRNVWEHDMHGMHEFHVMQIAIMLISTLTYAIDCIAWVVSLYAFSIGFFIPPHSKLSCSGCRVSVEWILPSW